jgi:hypothetical protein
MVNWLLNIIDAIINYSSVKKENAELRAKLEKYNFPLDLPTPKATIGAGFVSYDSITTELKIKGLLPSTTVLGVAATHSMEPMIDVGRLVIASNNQLYIDNLEVGEVVVYHKKLPGIVGYTSDGYPITTEMEKDIIHQIVEIGADEVGWYCRTKGTHPLLEPDAWKVRKNEITSVVRGVLF